MAAIDIAAIRQALADAASAIPELGQVSPYMLANPTPPAAHVIRGPVSYDLAGSRGLDEREFTIQAFVAFTSDIGAPMLLDKLLDDDGSSSMKAALEADTTLGGLCSDLTVTESTGEQIAHVEAGAVLMSQWTLTMLTEGGS